MSKPTLRVYLVRHHDGRRTGILMRRNETWFDAPPPSAYGETTDDVLALLESELVARLASSDESLDRYVWEERFETRELVVDVHPLSFVKKQPVVGARSMPLRLTYAWSKTDSGAFRVMLPRFRWWLILEELGVAPEALNVAVANALLGEQPRWLYEFRHEGPEAVLEWDPETLRKHRGGIAPWVQPSAFPTLESVAEEWVELAAKRKLPSPVGSHPSLGDLREALEQEPPPSLLVVGGHGVGKTTLLQRIAHHLLAERRAKRENVPQRLWATSADRIFAGMVFLGMWQQRCLELVRELTDEGDLLYVGSLPPILAPRGDGGSIADFLREPLDAREISVVAECTESELERCRRIDPGLLSHFQVVRLTEPSTFDMPALVEAYLLRQRTGATLHPTALRRLVQHLDGFERTGCFPGKAFRFVDWLGKRPERERVRRIDPAGISELYSSYSGLPIEIISDDRPAGVDHIADRLAARVIGQPGACVETARVLARLKAGLDDPLRPVGSLLFIGPTGVGKTELAKQVARYLFGDARRMIRLDMSEYAAPGAAQRLLSVGPGVSSLAERVRQQPLSLVLLDEIEKAHPEAFDLLLGILGEGRLTDNEGRFVDFRMSVIVMTSNLGVSDRAPVGFGDRVAHDYERSLRDHFRPEFLNRIDRVVVFSPLGRPDILKIVDLLLVEAHDRPGLRRRGITLDVHAEARNSLARLGYHPTRGARPLRRVIEEKIITPLAVRMSNDPRLAERTIRVVAEGSTEWQSLTPERRTGAIVV